MWWIWIAYAAIALAWVTPLAEDSLERVIETAETQRAAEKVLYPATWRAHWPSGPIVPSASYRQRAVWLALIRSLFWPLTGPVMLLSRRITAPAERRRALEKENAELRELAKQEGLDWPGVS